MTASEQILELIERFRRNLDVYKRPEYKEAQLRVEFINPFFEALGWDVRNEAGLAEQYKDVIHEDALKVSGATQAPDYCFRVGGTRKFFLEAKKPSAALKGDIGPAYQLRRYAWSAKLPLSILTDFEEFAVYDCRQRPKPADKASVGRVMYYTFDQYPDHFDDIYAVFAKDSVLKGSFDRYVQDSKQKRGTGEVDTEFLKEIEGWRDALARNIALRNPLSVHELNDAVQRTIDRIIFLRICEDRGIEAYGRLLGLVNGSEIYPRLVEFYRQADEKYNAGLFDFQADTLTKTLTIDDKVLKPILVDLYYPQSPYEFSVLPADILGQVYEQFLGKVIRLTPAHHAVVEEKPEVKKAGGVYYTPTYIVDYIVRQTVGKLVEGKSPQQLSGSARAAPLRILDPACGSGSFLLGAYQYLLDHCLRWYESNDPEKHARGRDPAIYRGAHGDWRLTTAEKKRILLTHIYGVDIDRQAVEVTKLSLLLKVLEGEQQVSFWGERALPSLEDNVKCGNSLIGPDYYAGRQMGMFDDEEMRRVNVFDWQTEFPKAMTAGGFDAVIGNPPYVRSINLKEYDPLLWDLYRSHYQVASTREWDIYLIFVEKGVSLIKANGKLGYILPNKFLNSQVGENLRAILADGHFLERLVHFGAYQIFSGATTYTCLLFLDRDGKDKAEVARYGGSVNKSGTACPLPHEAPDLWTISAVPFSRLTADPWEFSVFGGALLEKIKQWPNLESIAQVFQGTGTRADKVYAVEDRGQEGVLARIYSRETGKEHLLEGAFLKQVLCGRNIGRYKVDPGLLLITPYKIVDGKSLLVSQQEMADLAPRTLEYLRECKPRLDKREKGRFKGENWYCYGRPQNMVRFEVPEKVVLPDVANRGTCFLDRKQIWLLDTAYAIVLESGVRLDYCFILAILNSPLLTYFLKETGTALRGGYFRMKTAYLNPFPIRTIDFDDPTDVARHDKMVALVEQMLALHQKLSAAATPADKKLYQRQIDATDRQIDALVYKLYGLTEEEIAIVEGADKDR